MRYTKADKYRCWLVSEIIFAAILFTVPLTANAVTITVTNLNDSGPGSLRQAIADAASGDTIKFSVTGRISLRSSQLVVNKNLSIQGPGAGQLTISGNNASRVFYIGVMATLDGMTISDGYSLDYGGGIFASAPLTLRNSTVSGNTAVFGGGIASGGGYFDSMTVVNSTVTGNTATAFGGGIFGNANIINSTVSDNLTEGVGGGIFADDSRITITNSTISGNSAMYVCGGIYNNDGLLDVRNSTISENVTVSPNGAGICNSADDGWPVLSLINTIVAGNMAVGAPSDISGSASTASHNLIGDANSSGGIQNGVNGNIVGANPLLGPLANNGGPTMTHALLPGSPAINAGDNCILIVNGCGYGHPALPTDQRGFLRFGTVDIGAFERRPTLGRWSDS